MFDRRHYVPILKTKMGEHWALEHLTPLSKGRITPLMELHKHATKSPQAHVTSVADALLNCWGVASPLFFDTAYYGVDATGAAVATMAFHALQAKGVRAIPVLGPERSAQYRTAIRQIAHNQASGAMIRIRHEDVNANFPMILNGVVQDLGLAPNLIDLLLDYRGSDLNLGVHLPRIPNHNSWRTLTVASGSFPRSIGAYQQGVWHDQPREEWAQWLVQARNNQQLVRIPTFADYVTRDPGAPASGGAPSVNVRYALGDRWLVRLGGKLQDGAAPDMIAISADLVARPQFSGAGFSAGDAAYLSISTGVNGTGGTTQWTQWPINHHLEFVSDQIANLP